MVLFPRQVERRRVTGISWIEVRCAGCGRLLQKIEHDALRPGKRIEIKCGHCKAVNDLIGTD